MLAACSGRDMPVRASNDFVERTFDSFAASFESKLARLHYRAPALVGAMLDDSGLERAKRLDVLDAGCGTGLCGSLIAPYARHLTGVDLSNGMLAHAREKQVYDELLQAELTGFLRDHPDAFDVIVSADTLVYFGALDEVVGAAARALRSGGLLIFTLEEAVAADVAEFHLEMHGRYTHAQAYVERLLTAGGLTPEMAHAELRMESGVPVAGLVVRARKG
jgi:predicted TPR repeat methyltransferase